MSSTPYLRRLVASGAECLLSPYTPHSWWHEHGRRSMVRRLEAKGFPQLWGWLFVTVTVDPELFGSEVEAFEAGSDRLRRMVKALRGTLGEDGQWSGYAIKRWFSKFELTEAGWPHWHLGFDCRDFIANDEIESAWGLGFTKTVRVKKRRDFRYLFKYVVKGSAEIPDWVLDYPRRIRVFQTSVGFYGMPSAASGAKSDFEAEERATLREKLHAWSRRGQVRFRDASYRAHPCELNGYYSEIFIRRVEAGARALDAYHVPLTFEALEKEVKPWKPKQPRQSPPLKSYPNLSWDSLLTVRISSGVAPSRLSDAPSLRMGGKVLCL